MSWYNENEAIEKADCATGIAKLRVPTLRERMQERLTSSLEDAKRYQRIIELLDKNPEMEEVLTLMGQKGVY